MTTNIDSILAQVKKHRSDDPVVVELAKALHSQQARIAELEAAPAQTQGKVLTDGEIYKLVAHVHKSDPEMSAESYYSLSANDIRAIIAASTSKDSECA